MKAITDHLGNTFKSAAEMCRYWNVVPNTFYGRIERGYSIKDALLGISRYEVKDHLGNSFATQKEMLEKYGINAKTFRDRLIYGWSLEEALTTPPEIRIQGSNHIGIEKMMNCGLKAKIIRYNSADNVLIEFEDGETVECDIRPFNLGKAVHPILKTKEGYKGTYGTYSIKCIEKDQSGKAYYLCKCNVCETHEKILMASQMLEHIRKKHPDRLKK